MRANRVNDGSVLTRREFMRAAAGVGLGATGLQALGTVQEARAGAGGSAAGEGPNQVATSDDLSALDTKSLVKAMRDRTFSDGNVAVTIEALARAGIGVFEGPGDATPMIPVGDAPSPVRILWWQARNLALELSTRGGQPGADLDGLVIAADGMLAPSFLLAGYVATAGTAGGEVARAVMGKQDWTAAPALLFPMLVQTLYLGDVAREAQEAGEPAPTNARLMRQVEICPSMLDFVGEMVETVLLALMRAPEGTPGKITEETFTYFSEHQDIDLEDPVVFAIVEQTRAAAAVIAVGNAITSLVRFWSVRIDPEPTKTRFGVGDEVIEGVIGARVDLGGLTEWPTDLVACAAGAKLALPLLSAANSPVEWVVTETPIPLASLTALPGSLDGEGRSSIGYVTHQEGTEEAEGVERKGRMAAKATVERADLQTLVETLFNAYFQRIQSKSLLAGNALAETMIETLWDGLAVFKKATGQGAVSVVYHDNPLVGVWQVVDEGKLAQARIDEIEIQEFPLFFLGQSGSLTYTFGADHLVEVSAAGYTVVTGGDNDIGHFEAVIEINGVASGTYTADGSTLVLDLTESGGLLATQAVAMNGAWVSSQEIPDATPFVVSGSSGYDVSGKELLLFPTPGLPAIVLRKIG